jgi:hypothetical protein
LSSIGGFAEHQGSTTLHTAQASNQTDSERTTLEAAFKSMPQSFTAALDQLADCLAKT